MKSDEGEPVWLEEWAYSAGSRDVWVGGHLIMSEVEGVHIDGPKTIERLERASLAAAAPAMVRALLRVEWVGRCPLCDERCTAYPRPGERREHWEACPIDAALTLAGFPDQPSRDAARDRMGRHVPK
jgi:hypothetical protein